MFDPLTLLMVGAGILTYREMNRKDYGILTPSRDERYRNAMEYCHQPEMLLEEVRLFAEYGLKAQAAMLKRRAEWRARPLELKVAHEEVYQKALKSTNIPVILDVAQGFEGWTATKKAANLREHVRVIQETMLQEIAQKAANAAEEQLKQVTVERPKEHKGGNGAGNPEPFTGVVDIIDIPATIVGDDT